MQSENNTMFLSKILYVRENVMKKYNIGVPELFETFHLREYNMYRRTGL